MEHKDEGQDETEQQIQRRIQHWHNPDVIRSAANHAAPLDDLSIIPTLDLSLVASERSGATALAQQLHEACTAGSGFFYISNHGITGELLASIMHQAQRFHALPMQQKMALQMNALGVGYMPINQRKLPTREKGNLNEAFFIKRELGPRDITLDRNQWPPEDLLPSFREACSQYASALEHMCKSKLLPLFAHALGLPPHFFHSAFQHPLYRLRLSHYPPAEELAVPQEPEQFGIAPHVDTTFITILHTSAPGLCVHHQGRWVEAALRPGQLLVNTGQLLQKWSNDRFRAVLHFANNRGDGHRYSVPFFLNADADYRMECLPTCCGPDNPPKYPAQSYLESEGVVQGE